jgi:hypothetical protein
MRNKSLYEQPPPIGQKVNWPVGDGRLLGIMLKWPDCYAFSVRLIMDFTKAIKEWHNGLEDKDFSDLSFIPPTLSPLLQEMRKKTIECLTQVLESEDAKALRGDYKQLAECKQVIDEKHAI